MEGAQTAKRRVVSRSRAQNPQDRAEIQKLRHRTASVSSMKSTSTSSGLTTPGTLARRLSGDTAVLPGKDKNCRDSHKMKNCPGRPSAGPQQRFASADDPKNPTPPRETTLFVRLHEVIKDMAVLGEVLRSKAPGVYLEPTESCIEWDDSHTFCFLNCESKNQAKKLKDLIMSSGTASQPPRIDCSFSPFRKEQGDCEEGTDEEKQRKNQTDRPGKCLPAKKGGGEEAQVPAQQRTTRTPPGSDEKRRASATSPPTDGSVPEKQAQRRKVAVKKEEDKALSKDFLRKQVEFELKNVSEQVLKNHSLKAEEVKQKIVAVRNAPQSDLTSRYTSAEMTALENKLEELEKQEAEFHAAMDGYVQKLDKVLGQDDYKADVATLRKRLGLERYRLDKALPMYAHRRDVVELVQQHQVSILLAETGSGKSTQVVQYLLDAGMADKGAIVCTQPRKVAAISLATHVARELATSVGGEVGYKVGNRLQKSASTKLLYMTDHSLLNECLTDPDLKAFSCVVVDEAHERSLFTDLLLTMVKRCLPRRPDLRVVITSATIDPQVFVSFFSSLSSCPIMRVSGRAFPVDVVWEDSASEENEFENYVDAAVDKAAHIHRKEPPGGDILVFVTSASEIQKCCDSFQQKLRDRADTFQCFPLHGQLQAEDQQKVFMPLEAGKRKVVFATNCAETSITIDGIKYVVDTGVAKEMVFDAKKSINALVVTAISQSSAEQRKGRAGRTAPGTCYRLYSRRSYQAMGSISLPEILKTHLGHALLKLAELGVTPDMYDFVQSPSQQSIDVALSTLRCLGAFDKGVITDVGRWIARLPFDPKLGRMMLHGRENGLLYDSIVLASLATAGSGLFYRGATQESMKKLDKVRLKFSHAGGDLLTALEVYKAWQAVGGERPRNKWCMDNSVNAKVIRIARDSVKDVVQILKKEVKMEVAENFSDSADTPDKLRKMIFLCNASNLCHYLGKERAGYFAAQASRQVHFHPSSAMTSLASYPRWVVYDQLLQTSRDFITGITTVDDAWLQEVGRKQYGFDLDLIRQKKMSLVFTQPAGTHAFYCMTGLRYANLRRYEEMISSGEGNSAAVVAVEASRDMGELKVFSTEPEDSVRSLAQELSGVVKEAVLEVRGEVREQTIGSEDKGLRVVLGEGGELVDILMPHETRKVYVTKPSDDASEGMIREKFEQFGDVRYVHQFPGGRNWGFVVFRTPAQAEEAQERTKKDDCNVGQLEARRTTKQQAKFKAKLFWCRRPCTGIGFVDISPCYMSQCLLEGAFYVDNELVKMKVSRKNPDASLHLSGLPPLATKDLVKRSLLNAIGEHENAQEIIDDVTIIREKVNETTKKAIKHYEKQLKTRFQSKLKFSTVEVTVRPPRAEETRFSAEACFSDPIEGFDVCSRLQSRVFVESCDTDQITAVDIEPVVSAMLRVQRPVYNACREELVKLDKEKLKKMNVEMEVTEDKFLSTNSLLLFLKATAPKYIIRARTYINYIITGEVLDGNAIPALRHLLTSAGRKMLKEAERTTSAYISFDNRKRTISIHGSEKACTKVKVQMNKYLDEVLSGTVEELVLRGEGRAPGLLKALLTKYGDDVEALRVETGLLAITVDYRMHKVKLTGPPDSLTKAKETVEELNSTLQAVHQLNSDSDDGAADCAACFCPIDKGDLYRLEACAHAYCKDCIKHQISIAVKDHNLPVLCCHDGCDLPLAWRDFNWLARNAKLKLTDLATSSLSAYVLSNREKAAFCATADCPMVYRVTPEDQADVFLCPECNTRTCTACHAQAHDGLTCAMLKSSEKEIKEVEKWVNEDKKNRMLCPSCKTPIEKNGGCNRMVCTACRAIICWLCGKLFPTNDACYQHLTDFHGGIFDVNDLLYN